MALVIHPIPIAYDGKDSRHWLDKDELEDPLFNAPEKDLVSLQGFEPVKRPWLLDSSLKLKVDDE